MVALLAIYIIAAPYLPQITWWAKHDAPAPIQKIVHRNVSTKTAEATAKPTINGDQLIIPKLDMQEKLNLGDQRALHYGVWLRPNGSTPDRGGNTVLVGHRFTYAGPAVFYFLDKVQVGDSITLSWQGKLYEYKVSETKVVPPSEVSIEDNTKDPQLTIYTCTPLWTAKNRLVIVAKPVEGV